MKTIRYNTVVFDIDKTLSWGDQRVHLLPPQDARHIDSAWDEFNLAAGGDSPILENIELLNVLSKSYKIIVLTARSEICRDVTEKWLLDNGVYYDDLVMRGIGDCRGDGEFKVGVLLPIKNEVLCCFDDQPNVCDALRRFGITCHQVARRDELEVG